MVARAPAVDVTPSRLRQDRGAATSLAVALLTPMFIVLAFAAFQAALWSHARTEARVVARDTAALVARSGVTAGDAQASATAVLEADTDLRNVAVTVGSSNGVVTVTITGDAPGIIRGTTDDVTVTAAVPIEEITP
jgi:Flp pilus assembly protein TadG